MMRETFFFIVTAMVGVVAVVVVILMYRWPDLIPQDLLPVEYHSCAYIGVGRLAVMSLLGVLQTLLDLASS